MRLNVDTRKSNLILTTRTYTISYSSKEPSYVRFKTGEINQKLCIWSSCDASNEKDVLIKIVKKPHVEKIRGGQRIYFDGQSSLYKKKKFILDCYEDRVEYYYTFQSDKPIDKIHYFKGWGLADIFKPEKRGEKKGKNRIGEPETKEIKSSKDFVHLFNPEPNGLDRQWVSSQDYAKVSVNNDPDFNGANWFFTPGILAFAVADQANSNWISFGLAVKPGEYNFNDYEYDGGRFFGLTLCYFGKTVPGGDFETPHVVIHIGESERDVLEQYINHLVKNKLVKRNTRKKAGWWREPIFCGWGEQCYQGDFQNKLGEKDRPHEWAPYQYANQANYENMVGILAKNKIPVKTIVLDDKWQKERGLPVADEGKWPDLRGFIDLMHKKNKKVLLWWGLFTGEGVPKELCITKGDKKLCEDPTNPEFIKLLRGAVKKMLSDKEGCYNADGFKIDFTANLPADYGAERAGKAWGIELLKQYLEEIYKTAKKVKKDAYIITHTANPYFMTVADSIRLNDICNHYQESIVNKMEFRAEMADLACPGLLIDTDNWPCPTRKSWLEYMEVQPVFGVPSLYYTTHIDTNFEEIQPEDWKRVSRIWKDYIKSLKKK
jgi:glycosyl hydrolase family 31